MDYTKREEDQFHGTTAADPDLSYNNTATELHYYCSSDDDDSDTSDDSLNQSSTQDDLPQLDFNYHRSVPVSHAHSVARVFANYLHCSPTAAVPLLRRHRAVTDNFFEDPELKKMHRRTQSSPPVLEAPPATEALFDLFEDGVDFLQPQELLPLSNQATLISLPALKSQVQFNFEEVSSSTSTSTLTCSSSSSIEESEAKRSFPPVIVPRLTTHYSYPENRVSVLSQAESTMELIDALNLIVDHPQQQQARGTLSHNEKFNGAYLIDPESLQVTTTTPLRSRSSAKPRTRTINRNFRRMIKSFFVPN